MKITKQQLKQIIKEEIEATLDEAGYFDPNREPGEGYPFGKPLPGLRGALKDFVPKSMAHAVGNKLKAVHSLKDVVSLMGSEGKRRGHAIGSDRDPGYVRENTKE